MRTYIKLRINIFFFWGGREARVMVVVSIHKNKDMKHERGVGAMACPGQLRNKILSISLSCVSWLVPITFFIQNVLCMRPLKLVGKPIWHLNSANTALLQLRGADKYFSTPVIDGWVFGG